MDIRKKLFSIVGVLALTMSMTAGMASAQTEVPVPGPSDTIGLSFVVSCAGSTAPKASSATIGRSSGTGDIVFPIYDAAASGATGTVSTDPGAFRVTINLDCATSAWYVTAAINDFEKTTDPPATFAGSKFQLNRVGTVWTTDGTTEALNVAPPAAEVMFTGTAPTYTSSVLAQSPGTATVPSMYMDFTGQLTGLDTNITAGTYRTMVTVTFYTGTP